jgi:transcriptional regulator CtsR
MINVLQNMKNSAPFYPINTEIIEWWGKTIRSVGAPFDFGVESRFDYEYIIDGKVSGGGYINRHRRTMFSRIDLFDQMVRDITKMGIKKHTSELEKRVLNAIDIF